MEAIEWARTHGAAGEVERVLAAGGTRPLETIAGT